MIEALPNTICNWKNIIAFTLQRHNIKGFLPDCVWQNWKKLEVLEYYESKTTDGIITNGLCNLTNLTNVRLAYLPYLQGWWPLCFTRNLTKLVFLEVLCLYFCCNPYFVNAFFCLVVCVCVCVCVDR